MNINEHTKISSIIKMHESALDAIISISPKFEKLRNPILRKLMADRASIQMACKVASCSVEEFFNKLRPLGFVCSYSNIEERTKENTIPDFIKLITTTNLIELDVRPILSNGQDPLNKILNTINNANKNSIIKIINSFEPSPLIELLKKQGFEYYIEKISNEQINTYFKNKLGNNIDLKTNNTKSNFDEILLKYKSRLVEIDVRNLEMPMPMMNILVALNNLKNDQALFVFHKKIPVFLLPELADRKFDYAFKEIDEHNVNMIIFHNGN